MAYEKEKKVLPHPTALALYATVSQGRELGRCGEGDAADPPGHRSIFFFLLGTPPLRFPGKHNPLKVKTCFPQTPSFEIPSDMAEEQLIFALTVS